MFPKMAVVGQTLFPPKKNCQFEFTVPLSSDVPGFQIFRSVNQLNCNWEKIVPLSLAYKLKCIFHFRLSQDEQLNTTLNAMNPAGNPLRASLNCTNSLINKINLQPYLIKVTRATKKLTIWLPLHYRVIEVIKRSALHLHHRLQQLSQQCNNAQLKLNGLNRLDLSSINPNLFGIPSTPFIFMIFCCLTQHQ